MSTELQHLLHQLCQVVQLFLLLCLSAHQLSAHMLNVIQTAECEEPGVLTVIHSVNGKLLRRLQRPSVHISMDKMTDRVIDRQILQMWWSDGTLSLQGLSHGCSVSFWNKGVLFDAWLSR